VINFWLGLRKIPRWLTPISWVPRLLRPPLMKTVKATPNSASKFKHWVSLGRDPEPWHAKYVSDPPQAWSALRS